MTKVYLICIDIPEDGDNPNIEVRVTRHDKREQIGVFDDALIPATERIAQVLAEDIADV